MNSRISIVAIALALFLAACSGTASQTTTTTATSPPSTEPAPSTTTIAPTTTSTTTTTLKPTVALPVHADAFGYRIEFDATVRQPGSTDIQYSSVAEGEIVGDTDSFTSKEFFGTQVVRDASYVVINNEGWVKEDRKPWRALGPADVLSIKSATITPTDFSGLYGMANTLPWEVEAFAGRSARVYEFPADRAGDLEAWLPDFISRDLVGVEEYSMKVWIDAESEYLLRVQLDASGPETMLADGAITESGEGDLDLEIVYEFMDINDSSMATPTAPDLSTPDAPDGFYVFESNEFGFRLNSPLEWTLFPAESFDGYEIPYAAAPSIDVPNDSYFSISIEDLSGSQGLRVDEYAELTLRFITPFNSEVTTLTSEAAEVVGLPGWLTVAEVDSPDEAFTVRTLTVIDGSLGYSLEFYSWDDWYEIDLEDALEIFESFELFDPGETST